jgi:gas vesicle protein
MLSFGMRSVLAVLAVLHVVIDNSESPLVTTLLPAVIGAVLGFFGSVLLRRGEHGWQERREADTRAWQEQRERTAQEWQAEQERLSHEREVAWQEQRDSFARDLQIARPLDDALVETQRRIQGELVPDGESRWMAAHGEWQDGWVRITPHLTDAELEERYQAVGTILLELNDRSGEAGVSAGTLVMVAMRAILNARLAVAYFLRGVSLPPACFPGPQDTIQLLGQGDPTPLVADAPLRRWLAEHDPPPWR